MTEQAAILASPFTCRRHETIDPIASAWDGLVPRDVPHLRSGFLRAIERGRMLDDLCYLTLRRGEEPVAAAVVYTLPLDTVASAPAIVQRLVGRVRRLSSRFLWTKMRVCGSPISNAESGIYLDPRLSPPDRRTALLAVAQGVFESGRKNETYFFKEFDDQAVEDYAGELESLGFFPNDPWAGTRLDLAWNSFDGYLAALKKKYRKRIRDEVKMAERDLEFTLLDQFADQAPTAVALYGGVLNRAKFAMEKATEAFFAAVSDFDQARLLVARKRSSGEVLGVNLLLFGDTCMHNLYIGFDYAQNDRYHIYFNLVIESLRRALERGCRVCYLGQDSYEFKARLGARPVRLTAYLMHCMRPVHAMLHANRATFFPPNQAVTHDVFQASGRPEADAE